MRPGRIAGRGRAREAQEPRAQRGRGIERHRQHQGAPEQPTDPSVVGIADPAVHLHAGLQHVRGGGGAAGEGTARLAREHGAVPARVERRTGPIHGGTRQLDRDQLVRGPVLQRLEAADRRAELLAQAQVGERLVEPRLHQSEQFGTGHHAGEVERRVHHRFASGGEPVLGRDPDRVERHRRRESAVGTPGGGDRHARPIPGNAQQRAPDRHDEHVGIGGARVLEDAARTEVSGYRFEAGRTAAAPGERDPQPPVRDAREQRVALRSGGRLAQHAGGEHRHVEHRFDGARAPEVLVEHPARSQAQSAAAVPGRHEPAGPAQAGHAREHVGPIAVRFDAGRIGGRQIAKELRCAVVQQGLLVVEPVHAAVQGHLAGTERPGAGRDRVIRPDVRPDPR